MGLNQNTWMLDEWYAQEYANPASYVGANQLTTWGRNESGQLALNTGPGDQGSRSSPTQVGSLGTWKSLSYNIAVRSDNTLWTWGDYSWGQLGNNKAHPSPAPNRNKSSPIQVPGTWSTEVGAINGGGSVRMAVKTDGSLWMWGINSAGALGQNNKTARSSPVQVNGSGWGTGYKNMVTGGSTANIKTDGSLWMWGDNQEGELGQSNKTAYSSPVQVGSGTDWSTISMSYATMAAIKTDGSLYCWGRNDYGQIGANNRTGTWDDYSSPKQIPGTWSEATVGYGYMIATKTDGSAWAWGYNNSGCLGLNQGLPKSKSSPTQIPGTTWSKPIKQMYVYTSGAFKTDGSLWMWGDNDYGQLGQNLASEPGDQPGARKSSPVQVTGNWNQTVNVTNEGKATQALREL